MRDPSARPLAGRVGIVTGGGKGLGRAFALDLAAAGARVVVNNRNRVVDADGRGPADHVVAEIRAAGGDAIADYTDVADSGSAARIRDAALSAYGRIDFLVTNAAVSSPELLHKTTPERFEAVLATNIGGSAHLAAACSVVMRQAEFGRIVLVASTAGLHGEPTASAYSASKGAIIAFGRTIAVEGARRNVLTNVVLPFATTQMTEQGMDPRLRDVMSPHAVAPIVTALVEPTSTLNGQVIVAGGGRLRSASAVEYGTVALPDDLADHRLTADVLAALLAQSRQAPPQDFPDADTAFLDFADSMSTLSAATVP